MNAGEGSVERLDGAGNGSPLDKHLSPKRGTGGRGAGSDEFDGARIEPDQREGTSEGEGEGVKGERERRMRMREAREEGERNTGRKGAGKE
jgi:hypothetical protein